MEIVFYLKLTNNNVFTDILNSLHKCSCQKSCLERAVFNKMQYMLRASRNFKFRCTPVSFLEGSRRRVSRKVVVIGTCEGVLLVNKGQKSKTDVLKNPGIVAGKFFVSYAITEDRLRMTRAEKRSLESTKEAIFAKKRKKMQQQVKTEAEE